MAELDLSIIEETRYTDYNIPIKIPKFSEIYPNHAKRTDFSLLLGGRYDLEYTYTIDGHMVYCIDEYGTICHMDMNNYSIGIRPIISKDMINTDNFTKKYEDNHEVIIYGEIPQTVVDKKLSKILEHEYKNNKLQKNNKEDILYMYSKNENLNEYFYNNEKYVRITAKKSFTPTHQGYFSFPKKINNFNDGTKIKENKTYWVKVEPIKWLTNEDTNLLIAQDILISHIPMLPNKEENKKITFNDTFMKKYLENNFIKYIVPSMTNIKSNNADLKEEEQTNDDTILNKKVLEIRNMVKGKSYEQTINKELDELINEFNNNLKNNDENSILYDIPDVILNKMEIEIDFIISKLNKYNSSDNNYNIMLDYLNKLININNNYNLNNDEFINDINYLINKSLTLLSNDKKDFYYNNLMTIFNEEKEKLEKYIVKQVNMNDLDDFEILLQYSNKEELIYYLRNKIQPILKEVNNELQKINIKDSNNELSTKVMNENNNIKNNKMIQIYLDEMNDTYNKIKDYLETNSFINEEDKNNWLKQIEEIMVNEINYQQKLDNILNNLKNKWLSLNKILYDIEDYINNKEFVEQNIITR